MASSSTNGAGGAAPQPTSADPDPHPNDWYRQFDSGGFSVREQPLHTPLWPPPAARQADASANQHPGTGASAAEASSSSRRPLRIVVVGAGAAGLLVAFKAARQLGDGGGSGAAAAVQVTVYERDVRGVGGTWQANRYPGVQCDNPAHTYEWSFARNARWSRFITPGEEIRDYFERWARESGVLKDVRLGHRVDSAVWDADEAVWVVKGQRRRGWERLGEGVKRETNGDGKGEGVKGANGETEDGEWEEWEDRGEVLFGCNGPLSYQIWPDVKGLDKFEGTLCHSASWPEDLDLAGKTVAVVGGGGASGVQIVPAIQPIVKKLIVYLRSPVWATPGFRSKFLGPDGQNFDYSEDQKREWETHPDALDQYGREAEAEPNALWPALHLKHHDSQKLRSTLETAMKTAVRDQSTQDELLPDFPVGCRRTTAAPGFLEALQQPNVEVIRAGVTEFTSRGLIDSLGGHTAEDVDVIICATGFAASKPSYRIVGLGGAELDAQLRETDGASYLSVMAAGFPNLFYFPLGNAPVSHGSFLPILEWYVRWAFLVVAHMRRTGVRSLAPKQAAVDDFFAYTHTLMKRLAWSAACHSWFKKDGAKHGPVTAVWAGSRLHFYEALKWPRFEDFEMEYADGGNRFAYFGNGYTLSDLDPDANTTWYLDVLKRDLEAGHEAFAW